MRWYWRKKQIDNDTKMMKVYFSVTNWLYDIKVKTNEIKSNTEKTDYWEINE